VGSVRLLTVNIAVAAGNGPDDAAAAAALSTPFTQILSPDVHDTVLLLLSTVRVDGSNPATIRTMWPSSRLRYDTVPSSSAQLQKKATVAIEKIKFVFISMMFFIILLLNLRYY
jgi:hypothetical protein